MSTLREALSNLPEPVFADLLESEDGYLLVFDLPGATDASVDVFEQDGVLHIEAAREKRVPDGFEYRREDRSLFLDATIPLPPDASGEDAAAAIDRGVLEVHVPKRRAVEGRSIPIEDVEG
ncbi:MAG: Hsp20/alpha crystallin family protein [Halobacteriaceae archaeon]